MYHNLESLTYVPHPSQVQGCENTMPYLSDLVLFHSGQFYLSCDKLKWILYFIFGNYYELTCYVENSVEPDQPADLDLCCFNGLCIVSYCFKGVYMHSDGFTQVFVHYLFFNMGQVKLSMDKYLLLFSHLWSWFYLILVWLANSCVDFLSNISYKWMLNKQNKNVFLSISLFQFLVCDTVCNVIPLI